MAWGKSFDTADYPVGSELFVSIPHGWSSRDVARYVVERRTPKGQIVASRTYANGATETIRVTSRGDIVGDGNYGRRCVVTREDAEKIRAEARVRRAWDAARKAAESVIAACRQQDPDALSAATLELMGLCAKLGAPLRDNGSRPEGEDAERSGAAEGEARQSGRNEDCGSPK